MAFLQTPNPDNNGRFDIEAGETTIGRHPDCDLVVDAGAVSRFHAKVIRSGAAFSLEDLGSRNGTFLNGQLIKGTHALNNGDKIRICEVNLVFHSDAMPVADSGAFRSPLADSAMGVPEFARGPDSVSFDGDKFGVMMVDDPASEPLAAAKVEFMSTESGLKMAATGEAKLAALMKINKNLTGALALDEVLPKILQSLFDIFAVADRGFVVMKSSTGTLVPKWVKMRNAGVSTDSVRISRTIVRQAMDSGEALLSLDAMDDERFDSSESIADFSIRSLICAPLYDDQGNAVGAIQIDSTQGRGQFREEDVDLLSGVAAQASVLINHSRMHERAMAQLEVEQDLKLATDVQKAFLPQVAPETPGYSVSSFYQAAHHIGGDYFDYIHLSGGRVAVVVADVVGHGVAAAMYMAKLSAETRFCLASESDYAKALERLNDNMSRLQVERFVTFVMVVIDPGKECLTVVNAGHMAPIVRRAAGGAIEEPGEEESGLPIAIDEGMDYEAVEFPFAVGDIAVLYTDGVNEAMDKNDEEWGTGPVKDLVAQGGDGQSINDRIVSGAFAHMDGADQFDDMCMVVIERTGQNACENQGAGESPSPGDAGSDGQDGTDPNIASPAIPQPERPE